MRQRYHVGYRQQCRALNPLPDSQDYENGSDGP